MKNVPTIFVILTTESDGRNPVILRGYKTFEDADKDKAMLLKAEISKEINIIEVEIFS